MHDGDDSHPYIITVFPLSAMSILHDGMCALEESTIIIIIIINIFPFCRYARQW